MEYIKFPNAIRNSMQKYFDIARMPATIGCIDRTHVSVVRPTGIDAEMYGCRKGYFSINVQVICGPDLSFYNVVPRWLGSVHDSKIFENSIICQTLEDGQCPGHLLGESGYPCRKYLLTPLMNPQGSHEEAYNTSHIKTRNTTERAFSILKKRFACLANPLRTHLDTTKTTIVAAVVLHNLAIMTNLLDDNSEVPHNQLGEHDILYDEGNANANIQG